jgi:hypothetical protein
MALLNVEEQKINITMGYLSSLKTTDDINADDFIQNFIYNDRLNAEYIVNNNIFDILFDIYFALNPQVAIAELTEEIFYDEDGKEVYDKNKKPYVTLNDDAWKANSNRYYYYDILYEANKSYLTDLNSQSTFIDILMGVLTNFILNTNYYYQMLPDPGTSTTETGQTVEVDPSYFRYEHTNLQRSYFIFWKFVFTQLKDIFSSSEEIVIETALRELANNIYYYFVQNNLDFVKIIIDIYYNFLPETSTVFTNIDEQLDLISRQALINNEPIRIKNNTKSNKENKSSILNKTIDNYTKRRKPVSGTTATMSGKSKSKFVTQRRKPISGITTRDTTTTSGITTSGTTARDKFKSVTSGKSKSVIKRKPTIDINTIFKLNNPQRELYTLQEQSTYGGGRKRTHRRKKNKRSKNKHSKNKRKNKKTQKYRKKL